MISFQKYGILLLVFAHFISSQNDPYTGGITDNFTIEFKNECLKAMCKADSGCQQQGCARDIHQRLGCGYFRMNIFQYKQCFQPGRKIGEEVESAWIRCSEDYDCASNCIMQVAARFRLKCYGKSPCELLSRTHDGGANGCRTGATISYWHHVKELCPDC
uniref:lysozyme n=1 Tax=Parastrongyloides trichosuri TaxID=131310 RepID=A0A0N5A745_PARTI